MAAQAGKVGASPKHILAAPKFTNIALPDMPDPKLSKKARRTINRRPSLIHNDDRGPDINSAFY